MVNNETTIHTLIFKEDEKSSYYDVTVVFSISESSYLHGVFVKDSQEFIPLIEYIFLKEDYLTYLKEEEMYNLQKCDEDDTSNDISYYCELLSKSILKTGEYLKHQDNIFDYDEETNLFTFKDFVHKTFTTSGVLEDLKCLQNETLKIEDKERIIYNCLKTLVLFYD